MDSNIKQSEVEVYDNTSVNRPEYDAYWDEDHHNALLSNGAAGHFKALLDEYASTGRILVLGCGTGGTVEKLLKLNKEREVIGIELSKTRLDTATGEVPEGHFCRADAEELPFTDNSFDAVISHSILHHLPNWKGIAIEEINRVMSPSGSLIFYEPGKLNPPAIIRRKLFPSRIHTPEEHPFDPTELEKVLDAHFTDVTLKGHCIFSNMVPVLLNKFPIDIPTEVTELTYKVERRLITEQTKRYTWLLTGVVESPSEEGGV